MGRFILVALLVPATLAGQDPGAVVTDRPDQTESAEAVPSGFVQLELGWAIGREASGDVETDAFSAPSALLRIGVGGGVEIRVGLPAWISESETTLGGEFDRDGIGDGEIGFKWAFGSGPVQTALLGGLSVPIGEDDFSTERFDPSVRFLLAHDVTDRVSFGYNLGLAWVTEDVDGGAGAGPAGGAFRDTQVEAPYTFAIGFGLTDQVGAFVESFGAIGISDVRPSTHSVDGGLTLLLSDGVQLDLSGGVGLNDAAEDWFLGSGISLRLPR